MYFETENLSFETGPFVPVSSVVSVSRPSVVNNARCFEFDSLTSIGSFTNDCMKDFTGCANGYALNFFIRLGEFSTYDTEFEFLNLGEFKWYVTYQEGTADGVLVWQSEDDCKLTFQMPWQAWAHFSLYVNETHFQMFLNGEEMKKHGNCTIPLQRSDQFEIKVGETGEVCLDELSIVPVESMDKVPEFYFALTGKGDPLN